MLVARLLTLPQIQIGADYPVGPRSRTSCQRVLRQLVRHAYLDTLPGRRSTEPLTYLLTGRSWRGLEVLRERWGPGYLRAHLHGLGSPAHLLGVNEIRVRVLRARKELGFELRFWQRTEDLAALLRWPRNLLPDGLFQVQREVRGELRTATYFLEFQRANRSPRVLASKLRRYHELYYGGGFAELFGVRALRVLFVFSSDSGVTPTRRVSAAVRLAASTNTRIARFTTLDAVTALPPTGLLAQPIWSAPGWDQPTALFDMEKHTIGND